MLTRIAVKGYKSLENVEVSLKPLSVLCGPNAAGKSNFLDLLQLLSRIVSSRTLKEAFDPPYRGNPLESFSFGKDGIKGLLEKPSSIFTIEADIELSSHVVQSIGEQIRELRRPASKTEPSLTDITIATVKERLLRYRVSIEILPGSGTLRVADEYLAALKTNGEPNGSRKPFLEQVKNRLHLRMEGQAHPIYYERHLDHSILSKPIYPPHYPHLTAVRKELESWMFYYFEPRERMRANTAVKAVTHIGMMGEELPAFLNTIKATNPKQFKAIESALRTIIPSISEIDVRVNSYGEVELQVREGDRYIPARVVSEGTLRILGLLAIGCSSEHPGLTGFEEPENGVHPKRIRLIAERIRSHTRSAEKQMLITTHSTVLADLMPPESLLICRKKNGSTSIVPYRHDFPLMKATDIERAMDAEEPSVSTRIMRGDLDD